MENYKLIKLDEKRMPGGKKDTVVKLFKRNKKMLTQKDLKVIENDLKSLGDVQFMIRARNCYRMTTLKGFEDNSLNQRDDEYYENENEGLDSEKFNKFYYVEVTIRK